jgi:ligand-binding SRPBCC domain-containing protein
MNFSITTISGNGRMYAGQIISYKVTVLPLIRVRWVTEITHVREPFFFADEQRFGPYALWHHKHHFEESQQGVMMTDEVDYAMPFGLLGRMVHAAFVRAEVNAIFDHRYSALEKYFQSTIKR